jgi:hypothetical protein
MELKEGMAPMMENDRNANQSNTNEYALNGLADTAILLLNTLFAHQDLDFGV